MLPLFTDFDAATFVRKRVISPSRNLSTSSYCIALWILALLLSTFALAISIKSYLGGLGGDYCWRISCWPLSVLSFAALTTVDCWTDGGGVFLFTSLILPNSSLCKDTIAESASIVSYQPDYVDRLAPSAGSSRGGFWFLLISLALLAINFICCCTKSALSVRFVTWL